jgi:Fic family protein
MDVERYRSSPAGRLVPARLGEVDYWAFVPHPLPPDLPPDWELASVLSSADRALSELAGLGRTMPNPQLLIGPFVRREAVLSSRIEGTTAGIADLYVFETGQVAPGSDVREVHNYVTALEYGLERLSSLPVSLRLIRELHERLMQGVRGERATPGEFRQAQNWIASRPGTVAEADFVPPPVPEMHAALESLEKYLHAPDVYPPLVRLAFVHYQFETIHPFLDGNGRIGRLLLSLLLVSWNLLPLPLLYLSAYFERYRDAYYDLLEAVSARGAWREWVLYFLRGVEEQARDAVARAKRLQDLQLGWRHRLTQARASALLLRLVDALFQSPAVTLPQVQRMLGVTHRTASQAVARLVAEHILQAVPGRARNRQFVAPEVLAVLGP